MSETRNALTIAADPTEQVNPLGAITAGVQAARGVTGLRTEQFNLQQSKLQPAYQAMRMLMATNPNPSWDDVNAALAQSTRIGGNVDGLVANAAEIAGKGGKPTDFMRATALGGMSPWEQGQLAGPRQQGFNTGAGTVYGTMGGPWSATAGQFTPGGFIAGGLTPEQATTFVPVVQPDGTTKMVPRGTLFGGGMPIAGTGGGGGGAIGGADTAPINAAGDSRTRKASEGGPPAAGTPAAAVAQQVHDFWRSKGFSEEQVAGIMAGGPGSESNFNPAVSGDNGTSYGLYQHHGERLANMQKFFGLTGSQMPSADQQSQFAAWEISPQGPLAKVGEMLKTAKTPAEAAAIWTQYFGVPADKTEIGRRAAGAGRFQGLYAGGGGGGPPASGVFLGATSAQPVTGGAPVQPAGGGGPVQPAGGMQYFSPTGQPMGQGGGPGGGGGGFQMPGVQSGPGGAPILTPPAPWMGPIWEQSAKEYSTDVSREAGFASRIQPFQSALSIINAHPDLKTGPTSQQWNNWATTLSQYGIKLPSMPGDTVAAYQELSKALHQGLVNSGAFSGTDMARIEAEASSPNMQQQVEAIRELSARQIGYERFQMARLKQFRSLHPGEDPDQSANQYRGQTSTWALNLDPVAFGADNLTPQEIATYRKGLTPQQDEKFLRSLKEANRLFPEITPGGR
jgi:Phage tail lysozyme